ncbi:MAG: phosphatase [Candidatus Lumbricidophila eiseniae]|uniref:Phosphatase n=1 Tax=Candidatus Lumbricidiphila eiseniae TaxID=1969409 RepID=A0A2A6FQI4_9MICO|nr:MAG: phosphatase [Candidatus Lumbricidophila eiseniae]
MPATPLLGAADLHTHSTVSDGTDTPAALVHQAAAAGLWGIALTDHDSTAGWDNAATAARDAGIAFIPGIELSTRLNGVSVHVLGYLIDPDSAQLRAELVTIRDSRLQRAERIVTRIARDYDLTWEDVLAQSGVGSTIGRPHIADALVARGYEPTRSAAFDGILHPRAGYTQPHYAPDPVRGVELIRAAGGVAVVAHPGSRGARRVMTDTEVGRLTAAGLFGLELEHPENLPEAMPGLEALAERCGLAVTGSSDFHGTGKPNRLGECVTPPEVVAQILAAGTGSRPVL